MGVGVTAPTPPSGSLPKLTPSTEWIGHAHVCTSTHPQTRGLLHSRISAHQRTLLTGTTFSALNLSIPLCLTHTDSLTHTKPLAITTTPPSTQTHVTPWSLAQLQQTHNPHAFTLTPPVNEGPHHLIPPLNFPVPRASTHSPPAHPYRGPEKGWDFLRVTQERGAHSKPTDLQSSVLSVPTSRCLPLHNNHRKPTW